MNRLDISALTHRLVFFGLLTVNLILTVLYTRADVISNDDFYSDPGHLYSRDARWAVVPWLFFVDSAFANQQVAKPLGWLILAIAAATLAAQLAKIVTTTLPAFTTVATLISLALMTAPNLKWGPGIWYNAISFVWIAIALIGLSQAHNTVTTTTHRVWGTALWVIGTVGAALSYQPFALIPILVWLSVASSRSRNTTPMRRLSGAIFAPLIAVIVAVSLGFLLQIIAGSSRLDRLGEDTGGPGASLAALLFAYGRPAQVALMWALVVVAGVVVTAIWTSWRKTHTLRILPDVLVGGSSAVALVGFPLLLTEARQDRFASTLQISLLVALIAHAATRLDKLDKDPSAIRSAVFPGIALAAAAGLVGLLLALAGYPGEGAILGVIVGVWVVLIVSLWPLSVKRTPRVLATLMVASSLLVSYSLVHETLFRNWLSIGLDREVASQIALDITRLDLSSSEPVAVRVEVMGRATWYSPLLRLAVSGPEVIEQYLKSLNHIDPRVTATTGMCEPGVPELVTVTAESPTEVTVCVNLDVVAPD